MVVISLDQQWYNQINGQLVTVEKVTEYVVGVKTITGFSYEYDMKQFLAEYGRSQPKGK